LVQGDDWANGRGKFNRHGQPPTIAKVINGANPLVSVVNAGRVIFAEKDVYNNPKTSTLDKGLALVDAVVSILGFGELGSVTMAGKEIPKDVVLEGANAALQSADDLGAFDKLKK
jgi:hypothetical protein